MAPQFPSIQSFFPTTSSPKTKQLPSSSTAEAGDGFTSDEVDVVLHPTIDNSWTPTQDYEEFDIGALNAGPKCVTFMGRIVNSYDQTTPSKRPRAAKGCVKLILADDTGALTESPALWYANMEYKLRLGLLITVWTPHISHSDTGSLAPSSAPLFTSIFPERDRSCHFMIHENSDDGVLCKKPLGYKEGHPLPGLMTLKNFIDGGYDVVDARILVCVKSIGARKKFTDKNGILSEAINIGVFDDTAEGTLTLWGSSTASATPWQPSQTVLLISNPGWRIDRKAWISLTANTHVEVDPCIADAVWLRSFAQRLTKREHINPPYPEGVFDTESAQTSPVRVLYRLADIDEFARAAPKEKFIGYLSVIVMELNIVTLYRRSMLMCTECCGVPLYANTITAKCKQCEQTLQLAINPRLVSLSFIISPLPSPHSILKQVGPVIDETGQIATGKLIFSTTAWEQLLGRTADQLVTSTLEVLNYLEQRLLFLRVTLGFGWALGDSAGEQVVERAWKRNGPGTDVSAPSREKGEVGRLCIWCVKM
ncbi:hypothetical protein K432DRAFT_299970 [Lepidopterella palustris CBS 459.81]|uniref:Uncharacterized protein n=1 Tax=Lepidopterella palustris CBS 459.81 TaxID=1314670 RepID=A0A8E2E990_9PEZI|nr:hypothetical protein K432DRAFT_299970 [Lepidopterella palustris CBS 459.81]